MKIAVDCCDLDHSRIDGTRVYIKHLLRWFGSLSNSVTKSRDLFYLYHQKEFNPLLAPPKYGNYIDRKIPYKFCWTQTRLAFELRKARPDILWMPIQQMPFLAKGKIKTVVTIHDLAFKYFPDHFPLGDRLKINFFTDTAVKRANKVIAISEATKRDILKFYPKIPEDKIIVVHHGFDAEKFGKKYSSEEIAEVLEKYKITDSNHEPRIMNYERDANYSLPTAHYILYVGAIQPRKNLVTLIKAFEKLKHSQKLTTSNCKLVLAGEAAWKAEGTLEAIKKSPYKNGIVLTGRVNFDDLAKLYQGAQIFVYPSLYEGFGIPILEAMASGVPVVAARNSSLIEVGGNAVEFFESKDVDELADILRKILKSSTIKREMIRKGLERSKRFSWEKCAQETLEVLRAMASNQ